MFGKNAKMGLSLSSTPRDKVHELESEEHLENIFKSIRIEYVPIIIIFSLSVYEINNNKYLKIINRY